MYLLDELRTSSFLKISEIQEKFNVSPSTARRMCLSLEKKGYAIRGIGGVQYLTGNATPSTDSLYRQFSDANMASKSSIAQFSSSMVKDSDIIFISGGTTTALFSSSLAERLRGGELKNIVVATNSLKNADILGAVAEVIVTGGSFRAARGDLIGLLCEKTLQKTRFNKSFVGVDGIDIENGLMTMDIETARVDQIVLNNSSHTYILTDHSKFERNSFISYAHIHDNCTIITDSGLEQALVDQAEQCGVNLIVVGNDGGTEQ